jgi:hypothetical protein
LHDVLELLNAAFELSIRSIMQLLRYSKFSLPIHNKDTEYHTDFP